MKTKEDEDEDKEPLQARQEGDYEDGGEGAAQDPRPKNREGKKKKQGKFVSL